MFGHGHEPHPLPRECAPRGRYNAFLDARAVATWMVPAGMTSHVHAFEAREGGSFRISLSYDEPSRAGKDYRSYRQVPRSLRQTRGPTNKLSK